MDKGGGESVYDIFEKGLKLYFDFVTLVNCEILLYLVLLLLA